MNGFFLAAGIGLLGGAGAVARFAIHRGVTRGHPLDFPLATFIVNIAGAFVLGLLYGSRAGHDAMLLVGLGFLGGFTTFSTWMFESERLAVDGYSHGAARNIAFSTAAGFAAIACGVLIGRAF